MTKTILILSVPLSLIVHYIEKYFFDDWPFLAFLAVLIGLDTVLGFTNNWNRKTVSSKGFSKVLIKFMLYATVLVLTHVLKRFSVGGEQNIIFAWIDDVMYSAIVIREAISILENAGEIYPGLLPKWILARFKQFDETGNFKPNNDEKSDIHPPGDDAGKL